MPRFSKALAGLVLVCHVGIQTTAADPSRKSKARHKPADANLVDLPGDDACSQAFAEFKANADKLDQELRAELDKAKGEANSYVRLARLREVRRKYIESLRQQTPSLQGRERSCGGCGSHVMLYAGLPFDAIGAIFEAAKDTHRLFLKPAQIVGDAANPEEPGGNPVFGYPWQGTQFDRNLFCLTAKNPAVMGKQPGCTPGYGEACSIYEKLGGREAQRKLEQRAHELGQAAGPDEMRAKHATEYDLPSFDPDRPLAKVDPQFVYADRALKIESLSGNVVAFAFHDTRAYAFNCRTTNKVSRIDPDGTVQYVRDHCTDGSLKLEGSLQVSIPELPPDVRLAKGDVLDVSFELTDAKRTVLADKPTFQSIRIAYTGVARHLRSVKRGSAVLWHYGN